MTDLRAYRALDRLYADLPALECKRLCQASCGPIDMTRVERARITKRTGREFTGVTRRDGTCVLLDRGACGVYAIRPMLCRLWGLVETLRCPHGCVPERWLTHDEGHEFLRLAAEVSGEEYRPHPFSRALLEFLGPPQPHVTTTTSREGNR